MPNINLKKELVKLTNNNRLYQLEVPVIGLTGGIATGKSTVAKLFKALNFPVIDADSLVKSVYQKKEVFDFIQTNYPDSIVNQVIDFKVLRNIAFSNETEIKKIETEIYRHLPQEFLKAFSTFQSPKFVIYDVPLLFEKGLDKLVDQKIVVYSPESLQIERLIKRDQVTSLAAHKILSHQIPIEDKKLLADFVIDNSKSEIELEKNFQNIVSTMFSFS